MERLVDMEEVEVDVETPSDGETANNIPQRNTRHESDLDQVSGFGVPFPLPWQISQYLCLKHVLC